MSKGFIALHRKLLDNAICAKPNYLAVWIYILLRANYKEKDIIWNNKKVTLKRGQFIGSISKIAKHFNLSTGTVSYILDYFISERMLERSSTFKFTLFTVLNYDVYQKVERFSESKLKANRKQIETDNKDNKDNNINKKTKKSSVKILENKKTIQDLKKKFKNIDVDLELEKMKDWLKSNGKTYKDYKAFARNWLRRNQESGGAVLKNSKKSGDNNLIDLYKQHGLATSRN